MGVVTEQRATRAVGFRALFPDLVQPPPVSDLLTVAYVVGFFVLFVGSTVYLTWHSIEENAHSPTAEQ